MSQQLLPLGANPRHTFENFCADGRSAALAALRELPARGGRLWLCGPAGAGKSHLLQAACHRARAAGRAAAYLPLGRRELAPAALQNLERMALVCLDDLDAALGDADWERALFALLSRTQADGPALAMAARQAPAAAPAALPDLQSRLRGAALFRLRPLAPERQPEALRRRARSRGYELPEEAVAYLQSRVARDLETLCPLLDRLEERAFRERRRLTVPLLRELLEREAERAGTLE